MNLEYVLKWVIPVVVFVVSALILLFVRKIIFWRLKKWAQKTKTEIDDIIISVLKFPVFLWIIIISLSIAVSISALSPRVVVIVNKTLLVLGIFSITLVVANLGVKLFVYYSGRKQIVLPATSLTQNLIKLFIFLIGALIILNSLGVSITPILTTLGIGGLAVALALQDTLSNLFAGFYMTLAKQIKVGDFIKLESGEEGYVMDIGWRATRVRMLPNNVVLIPNNKLAQSIITNYYQPQPELAVLVQVGVHYDSDLEHVEKVTIEVAKEVMKEVPGGVPEFEPFIRYHTFGDFSINFTVILRAKEFVDNYLIKHEFIKRLHKRYQKEGIVIPYPIRALNFDQEKKK
jgi:small-conductance mechanosensitive channel